MGQYHRLTQEERYQIKVLRDNGFSIRKTAEALKRSSSTISRELRRNGGKTYKPKDAERKDVLE